MWLDSRSEMKTSISQEVNRLFAVYRQHTGREPMAGGAQNLIMKKDWIGNLIPKYESHLFQFSGKSDHFDNLPIMVKLYIFSFLSPKDLCLTCQVSRNWHLLTSDELLWERLLRASTGRWQRIYDDRNPDFYRRACASMSSKAIYLRCQPGNSESGFKIPNLWHYLVPSKPFLVMFGPGLETKTSRIVRSILTDQQLKDLNGQSRFYVTGMVPGEFAGVGSGISLKLSEHHFNLVTLYSNVKSVRQRVSVQNRIEQNKLFTHHGRAYEVAPQVRDLCRKSNGFVFVVDSSSDLEEMSLCQSELFAVLCELWASKQAPLLVLACNDGLGTGQNSTAIDIVRVLRLGRLKRKWIVQSGDVRSLQGIRDGFQWLLSQISCVSLFR